MSRLDRRDLAILAVLMVPWFWLTWRYWFVCDDAFITWRYSRNLAMGEGPRYNIANELPVEGYSDFLWMVMAALFEKIGLEPRLWMPRISALMGAGLLSATWVFLRIRTTTPLMAAFAGALFLATFPPFAVWSTSGLETMPQCLFMFGAWALLCWGDDDGDPWIAGFLGLMLALVRTEGVAWTIVIGGVATALRWHQGRAIRRPLLVFAGLILAPYAVYYAWRFSYYHSLVANTALAKVHLGPITLARGLLYIALYVTTLVTPLIGLWSIPASVRGPQREVAASAGIMAIAIPAYAVTVSGDYMAWFRILTPGAPFLAITIAIAAAPLAADVTGRSRVGGMALALAMLNILPTYDLFLVPEPVREIVQIREKLGFFRTENDQWRAMNEHVDTWTEKGIALKSYAKPGETYVAAAIGATGYYSGIYIYDRNGLVNREVAMQPWNGELRSPGHDKVVDRSFFFDKKPDILDAKVITANLNELRDALAEMEAEPVKNRYYPDLAEVDSRTMPRGRKIRRFLIVLRRADSPDDAAAGWQRFEQVKIDLGFRRGRPANDSANQPGANEDDVPDEEGAE